MASICITINFSDKIAIFDLARIWQNNYFTKCFVSPTHFPHPGGEIWQKEKFLSLSLTCPLNNCKMAEDVSPDRDGHKKFNEKERDNYAHNDD